ncbi:MAG: hypothetical protein WCK63_16380 [Betaproteobacteria bacterium]
MNVMEPEQLLHELDLATKAIRASEAYLLRLKARESSITDILETLTKPVSIPIPLPPPEIRRGFLYHGRFIECHTCVGLHRRVLSMLWTDFPERRETMATAVASAGYNRCYIAKERDSLFEFKSRHWTLKFSEEFSPGWFMDTNVTPERIKRILPLAVRASGLDLNKDFAIFWD